MGWRRWESLRKIEILTGWGVKSNGGLVEVVGGGGYKKIKFRRVGGGGSNGGTMEVVEGGGCEIGLWLNLCSREFEREGEFDRDEVIHLFECDRFVLSTGMLS